MEITLETLGLSQEDIAERVIEQVCHNMLRSVDHHEEGEEEEVPSRFEIKLQERIKAQIDSSIDVIAAQYVIPNITVYLEGLLLQETNDWGEKKGESITFIEYIISRAEHYMMEKVDHDGRGKSEMGGRSFSGNQTRIAYLVDHHLQYSISTAIEAVLQDANSHLTEGLAETVKLKLKEVQDRLKISVSAGR